MRFFLSSSSALGLWLASTACVTHAFTITPPPPSPPVVVSPTTMQGLTSTSALPSPRDMLAASSTATTTAVNSNNFMASSAAALSAPGAMTNTNAAQRTGLYIANVNYKGNVPTTEADEYVVVTNGSNQLLDVSGYYIYVASNGSQGATFTFPKDTLIKPNTSVRIYTNEIHKETGGFSFNSGKALWNNKGGLAVLKDAQNTKLGEFKYKPEVTAAATQKS
jgi:hypothetical protein